MLLLISLVFSMPPSPIGDIAIIRALREGNNQAITLRDLAALRSGWQDDIQVTISSGSHLDGAVKYLEAFENIFQNIPGVNFVRSSQEIRVSKDGKVASEQGRWKGSFPGQRITETSGTYMAVWRKNNQDKWLIAAEVYAPLNSKP